MSATAYFADQDGPRLYASEPTTPSFKVVLEYLNEGGANFVFRILPSASTKSLPPYLDGKLLRLRKDLPLVQSAKDELASFDEHFAPLFSQGDVISFELIQLEGITPVLNAALQNFQRPHHRKHDFLTSDEPYGLLVTDMTPGPGDILLQVKPKWLSQSQNAPPGSKRCRTCALRAHRGSQKVRTATDKQESCPLELVSSNTLEREHSAAAITSDEKLQDCLIHKAQPVLQTLKRAQAELDREGVLNLSGSTDSTAGESVLDLCKAMTLRDCTLFLRRRGDHVEARLADLDVKQPEKLERWRQVESELIGGGWYSNEEGEEVRKEERVCLLSRQTV